MKILQGDVPPPTVQDTIQLGAEEVNKRFRLACQTKIIADCKVMPMPPKAEVGHQILAGDAAVDDRLSLDSGVTKHVITAKAPTEEHHQTSARPDFQDIFVDGMEFSGQVFTPKNTRRPKSAGAGGA